MNREFDVVEDLLLKWADWMRSSESIAEGYPEKASGGFIESWIKDSEELVDAEDAREVVKINSTILSLKQPHYQIINKAHGISYKVWSFPNEDALYLAAKAAFHVKYFSA